MSKLRIGVVRVLLASYLYVLVKIILLKFGQADFAYLWEMLLRDAARPSDIIDRIQAGNLIPFHEISSTMERMSERGLINVVGNVLIFIPFGLLIGILAPGDKLTMTGAAWRSFAVSLALESSQAIFAIGIFDVDDLILNTAGGAIGFIIYATVSWLATSALRVPRGESAS